VWPTSLRPRFSAATVAVAFAAAVTGWAAPAGAQSAADARTEARAAAARVEALEPRVRAAMAEYDDALHQLARAVTSSISADEAAAQAERAVAADEQQLRQRLRALYMTGGGIALYASVLGADSAGDAIRQVGYVQRIVASGAVEARAAGDRSAAVRSEAERLEQRAEAQVRTVRDVAAAHAEVQALLEQQQRELARLSERARTLAEAEEVAARLAAARAAVEQAAHDAAATAQAGAIPADFRRLYRAAATTCPGLAWPVLAAIGQVESGHGRNTATSYAGARGPMQFLPDTFAAYAVDGDRDGDTDILDPADSIHTAARYLCANGAGSGDGGLRRALWHYNHADWYVEMVLRIAGQIAERESGGSPRSAGSAGEALPGGR